MRHTDQRRFAFHLYKTRNFQQHYWQRVSLQRDLWPVTVQFAMANIRGHEAQHLSGKNAFLYIIP